MPPPARPHDEEDADDDELSNPEFDDDEEEELLIADPNLYELHKPWGRRDILLAAAVIVAWYAVSISAVVSNKLMLRARRFPHPFTMLLIFAAAKWVLARLALLFWKLPPLAFQPGAWRPYLGAVAATGVLTAVDVGLGLCAYMHVTVTFVVIVRASAPCWQLLFGAAMGLEKPKLELVLVLLLTSTGVGLAALGDFEFNAHGFALVLASTVLAGLRACLLQRLLHGARSIELLGWRQRPHPLQVVYALAPWTAAAALALALSVEGGAIRRAGLFDGGDAAHLLLLRLAGLCALVFATVLAELSVVARTSALTLSVAATLKEVVTIGVAEEVFHDHLTKLNLFGLLLCLLGAQSYSMVKLGRTRKTPRSGFTPPPPPPHDHPRNGDLQPKRILGGGERWVRQD